MVERLGQIPVAFDHIVRCVRRERNHKKHTRARPMASSTVSAATIMLRTGCISVPGEQNSSDSLESTDHRCLRRRQSVVQSNSLLQAGLCCAQSQQIQLKMAQQPQRRRRRKLYAEHYLVERTSQINMVESRVNRHNKINSKIINITPTKTKCIRYYCSTSQVVMSLLMFILVLFSVSVAIFSPSLAGASSEHNNIITHAKSHNKINPSLMNTDSIDLRPDRALDERNNEELHEFNLASDAQSQVNGNNDNNQNYEQTATRNYFHHSQKASKHPRQSYKHQQQYFLHRHNNHIRNQQPMHHNKHAQVVEDHAEQSLGDERRFNDLGSHHQRTNFVVDKVKKSTSIGNDKWSKIHSLKHALHLHNHAHQRQVESNRMISPLPSLSHFNIEASESSTTDADGNNDVDRRNEEIDHDFSRTHEDDSMQINGMSLESKAEATSQREVPERLPIVVSYSDNSYVSASPIIVASGAKVGRLRTKSTRPSFVSTGSVASRSGNRFQTSHNEFRQISDIETVATTTTTTTTTTAEATTTIPTTATTTALLNSLRSSSNENNEVPERGSESNLEKFTKQALLWSDFSEGLDLEFSDDDEDDNDDGIDIKREDEKLENSIPRNAVDLNESSKLDQTLSEAVNNKASSIKDESSSNELVESTIEFDINQQYMNRPGTIIKTRESIEKGATFIKYTIVTNLNACLVECWITDSCDTAVYQESPVDLSSNNSIINSSTHTDSAHSIAQITSSTEVSLDNEPGRTSSASLTMQHNDIYQVTLPSTYGSLTPSPTFYQSSNNNYAIESDITNNVHTVETESPVSNKPKSNFTADGPVNNEDSSNDDNINRPRTFTSVADHDADNYNVKGSQKGIKHNVGWFKDYKNPHDSHNYHQRQQQQRQVLLEQRKLKSLAEHGFYICYLFECAKENGFKCDFSPHNFYTSSTKQQAFSNTQYSSLIRSPANFLPVNSRETNFNGHPQWSKIHRASIDINEEDISKFEQGGLNSAIIAIMFGVGATGMLIFIVGHKMKSIRRRVAYEGRRRSIVPDKDFLINTFAD